MMRKTSKLAIALVLLASVLGQSAWAWNAGTNISLSNGTIAISGTVGVGNGGTGAATFTANGVLMGNTASAFQVSGTGTSGQAFLSAGSGAPGAYGALDLSVTTNTAASAPLPISRGGTNATTFTSSTCVRFNGTSLVSASGDCATPINPPVFFGSGSDIAPNTATIYLGFGTGVDTTEGRVQVQSPGATYKNLRCSNTAIQGSGANHDVVVTARVGTCGSQSTGTLTCTITGSASANQVCTPDTTNTAAPTAGQCIDFLVTTQSAVSNPAQVNCVVERTA